MAERKPAPFLMEEKALCPHCGEKGGVRRGMSGVKQRYDCRICRRRWYGEPPTPPDRRCPYCKARCIKEGRRLVKGRKPNLTPLQQWLGYESEAKSSRVQIYLCTQCGRINTELWPHEYPNPNSLKERFGILRFGTTILLNSAAEEALVAYCRPRKLRLPEGMRRIFRDAAVTRIGIGRRVYEIRPAIPLDMPMPPLSDGRIKLYERKRGKLFGHREVIVVRSFNLHLDAAAYVGLMRTMAAKKMTRQEAARYLIVGTERKFVGMTGGRDEGLGNRD